MVSISTNKIQILLISIIIPIGLAYWFINRDDISIQDQFFPDSQVLHIGDIPLGVEIADSAEERTLGLSNREEFTTADGLLFVFPESGYHTMWMKDMNFPIDMIWIDEDLKVIGIEKNVSPDTYPKVFRPSRPAKYVVETNIHFSDTFGLHEGLDVRLPIFEEVETVEKE